MRIQHYHHQTMVQTVAKTTPKTHQATSPLVLHGLALKTKKEKEKKDKFSSFFWALLAAKTTLKE